MAIFRPQRDASRLQDELEEAYYARGLKSQSVGRVLGGLDPDYRDKVINYAIAHGMVRWQSRGRQIYSPRVTMARKIQRAVLGRNLTYKQVLWRTHIQSGKTVLSVLEKMEARGLVSKRLADCPTAAKRTMHVYSSTPVTDRQMERVIAKVRRRTRAGRILGEKRAKARLSSLGVDVAGLRRFRKPSGLWAREHFDLYDPARKIAVEVKDWRSPVGIREAERFIDKCRRAKVSRAYYCAPRFQVSAKEILKESGIRAVRIEDGELNEAR